MTNLLLTTVTHKGVIKGTLSFGVRDDAVHLWKNPKRFLFLETTLRHSRKHYRFRFNASWFIRIAKISRLHQKEFSENAESNVFRFFNTGRGCILALTRRLELHWSTALELLHPSHNVTSSVYTRGRRLPDNTHRGVGELQGCLRPCIPGETSPPRKGTLAKKSFRPQKVFRFREFVDKTPLRPYFFRFWFERPALNSRTVSYPKKSNNEPTHKALP